ncbi:MAG: hypothetical protein HZB47_08695 [Nitrosomonadales bacterium]|nr:hypothetical protein [Nitrosomonadales bacterium]
MIDTAAENEAKAAPVDHVKTAPERGYFIYESAGITERDARVPVWLWVVAVSLLIWGIYYLVTYWSAPAASL